MKKVKLTEEEKERYEVLVANNSKWQCPCGVIARVASDDFQATCDKCQGKFELRLNGEKP